MSGKFSFRDHLSTVEHAMPGLEMDMFDILEQRRNVRILQRIINILIQPPSNPSDAKTPIDHMAMWTSSSSMAIVFFPFSSICGVASPAIEGAKSSKSLKLKISSARKSSRCKSYSSA